MDDAARRTVITIFSPEAYYLADIHILVLAAFSRDFRHIIQAARLEFLSLTKRNSDSLSSFINKGAPYADLDAIFPSADRRKLYKPSREYQIPVVCTEYDIGHDEPPLLPLASWAFVML